MIFRPAKVPYNFVATAIISFLFYYLSFSISALPTPPKFITSNQKYHDQADLNWELSDDGGSPIHSITVQYKPQLDDIWTTIQVSKPILQYTLTNLEPNTIYDCRVLSTNNVGDSRFSEIFQVKTNRKSKFLYLFQNFIWKYFNPSLVDNFWYFGAKHAASSNE